jgi:hypothetical protein
MQMPDVRPSLTSGQHSTRLCVALALAPHALVHCVASPSHRAYFPVPMRRLAPMRDTLHSQLDPRVTLHVSFGSRALAVSLAPLRLLSSCVAQPLSTLCLCATPARCSPPTSAPRAALAHVSLLLYCHSWPACMPAHTLAFAPLPLSLFASCASSACLLCTCVPGRTPRPPLCVSCGACR